MYKRGNIKFKCVSINNVELQKHNYLTAIKIYLLCRDNLISNKYFPEF